jgi:hypothetical protein
MLHDSTAAALSNLETLLGCYTTPAMIKPFAGGSSHHNVLVAAPHTHALVGDRTSTLLLFLLPLLPFHSCRMAAG